MYCKETWLRVNIHWQPDVSACIQLCSSKQTSVYLCVHKSVLLKLLWRQSAMWLEACVYLSVKLNMWDSTKYVGKSAWKWTASVHISIKLVHHSIYRFFLSLKRQVSAVLKKMEFLRFFFLRSSGQKCLKRGATSKEMCVFTLLHVVIELKVKMYQWVVLTFEELFFSF